MIPAQAPARRVTSPKCNSTQTPQNPCEGNQGFILFILHFLFQSLCSFKADSAALCITDKTQFIKSKDMWNNFKHNCIIATRGGIKPNSTFIKCPLNGCIHQIITACRFNEMRLIRGPLENENINKYHYLRKVMTCCANWG